MKFFKIFVTIVFALSAIIDARAVTDKEMDEARAITAKEYLRWVNDGSGYLDDITVKSMNDLKSQLKAKEKENLSAFTSVKTPSDYASWDKAKLVEYWAVTFFTSPGLDAKGNGAKPRIRKKLEAMTVAAPVDNTPKNEEPQKEEQVQMPVEPVNQMSEPAETMPTAEEAAAEQQDILSDQQAIEKDLEETEASHVQEQSHTWVYVLVLAILIAVVIWLVVYAANLMKRQPGKDDAPQNNDDISVVREKARLAVAAKNEEIKTLHERLQNEENRSAELGMEIERMKLEQSRLLQQLQQLREQNSRIEAPARHEARREPELPREETRVQIEETPHKKTVEEKIFAEPVRRPSAESRPSAEKTGESATVKEKKNHGIIKVIYLGRTNRRGIFVRADRRINPGNTIYRLDTNDGLVGTFHVVDEPEVVELALSNPTDYLGGGCMGEDLQDTAGVTRILTVSAGTAIFENGYWKVLRKTSIRYE